MRVMPLFSRGPDRLSLLDRLLRPLGRVKPGEGQTAVLLIACLFLILSSYYVLKAAGEGFILSHGALGFTGAELKAYASGVMALLLVGVIPLYSALASRVTRIRLINVWYAVLLGCLLGFFALTELGVPIGLAFFIWLGLVNVFLIAQFWSFANDLYTEEQGERLFAPIAVGGSLGGIFGPVVASLASSDHLLLLAAVLIAPCVALLNVIDRIQRRDPRSRAIARQPISGTGAFHRVHTDRYLRLIAALVFVAALVKTTGDYVLSAQAADRAAEIVPITAHAELEPDARYRAITLERQEQIKDFYSDFFFWVNLASVVLQAVVVARVIDRLGVRGALFVMPIVALGAYGAIWAIGGIALIRIAKIAENSADYSLQNTVQQALFLPTDRTAKYKAKAAIDTLAVRIGDTCSALMIWTTIHALGLHSRALALGNILLIAVWLATAVGLAQRHRGLARAAPPISAKPPGADIAPAAGSAAT